MLVFALLLGGVRWSDDIVFGESNGCGDRTLVYCSRRAYRFTKAMAVSESETTELLQLRFLFKEETAELDNKYAIAEDTRDFTENVSGGNENGYTPLSAICLNTRYSQHIVAAVLPEFF